MSYLTRRSLLAAPIALGASAANSRPMLEKIDLFEAGKEGYATYRIPGLVVTAKGTVFAYCEARLRSRGDWGTIDLMSRRSLDGGRTWSPRQKLVELPGPHAKNPVALAQGLATTNEVTCNNPVAIVDKQTGALHMLFCYEYMRAFYMRSDDDGRSWSKPVEITDTFETFQKAYPWKVLAIGPGHGIQLRSGRLVAPVWISPGTGGHAHRPSVTATIYSDDHGKSWKAGDIAVPDGPKFAIPNETVAAELADGRVVLNVRSESPQHRRIVTFSKDGATGWTAPEFHDQLLEPICFASMVRLTSKPKDDRNRLLFSNPDNLERRDGNAQPGKNRDRRNLTIKMSYDEGGTWPASKTLEAGWSGYSDLAVLPDKTALCFYERGGLEDDAFRSAALTLARFNVEWLTDGRDHIR